MRNKNAVIANHKQNNADRSRCHCEVCTTSTGPAADACCARQREQTGHDKPNFVNERDKPAFTRSHQPLNKIGT